MGDKENGNGDDIVMVGRLRTTSILYRLAHSFALHIYVYLFVFVSMFLGSEF